MFQRTSALTFFPTFVWVHDLAPETREEVGRTAVRLVEQILTPRPPPNLRHQWQTPTDLQTRPDFAALNDIVLRAAENIVSYLELKKGPLEITGAWANVSLPGATHIEHSHPNNFLSFVYYPHAPKGGDAIEFHDPRPQAHVIAPPFDTLNAKIASTVTVAVEAGRLVAFPSWLRHSVPVHRGQGERMSIALNVMFVGSIGKPRWTGAHGASPQGGA
jgi:uncharacterized protein (TIGR02466 family)